MRERGASIQGLAIRGSVRADCLFNGGMDRAQLADFLRRRREALQPSDVGLEKGPRRRTSGLRREEVASLSGMSTDYYARLEQQRGPQPSEQMVAAIARGLRLTLDERDHLFRLAGHTAPTRVLRTDHVSPALMRVLDRLDDTPAQVISDLGETLVQNRLAVALIGDQTQLHRDGPLRHLPLVHRPRRAAHLPVELPRAAQPVPGGRPPGLALEGGPDARAEAMLQQLQAESPEFVELWAQHEVGDEDRAPQDARAPRSRLARARLPDPVHREPGPGPAGVHRPPGTEAHEKLQLLSVIGRQDLQPRGPRHLTSVGPAPVGGLSGLLNRFLTSLCENSRLNSDHWGIHARHRHSDHADVELVDVHAAGHPPNPSQHVWSAPTQCADRGGAGAGGRRAHRLHRHAG